MRGGEKVDVVDGVAVLLVAGETEEKRSPKLALCTPERACGAANCVEEVVVEVERGGTVPPDAAGCDGAAGAGVADWKSSNSSSSPVLDWRTPKPSPVEAIAGALPFVELVVGASSNEKRSTSGSFGFGGSAFFVSLLALARGGDIVSAFLLPGVVAAASSYSSYSSKRSLRPCVSENSAVLPPNPPPSP